VDDPTVEEPGVDPVEPVAEAPVVREPVRDLDIDVDREPAVRVVESPPEPMVTGAADERALAQPTVAPTAPMAPAAPAAPAEAPVAPAASTKSDGGDGGPSAAVLGAAVVVPAAGAAGAAVWAKRRNRPSEEELGEAESAIDADLKPR
jgi:2-oxoglutarate dehydrogenase E2 component (dihydrolipoamide succinyltransferase)